MTRNQAWTPPGELKPFCMHWRQNGASLGGMPSIQIKGVPPGVHRVLRRRAAEAGQSLQEYLLALMEEHASRPTLEEVLRRAGERAGGSVPLADAAKVVGVERNSR